MRIAYFSDFQMTHPGAARVLPFIDRGADVAVFAGDIAPPLRRSLQVLAPLARKMSVIYVAGNRDFYSTEFESELVAARDLASELGIHFLERSAVTIDGVRFAGGTLWTDYAINGNAEGSMLVASAGMSDHHAIRRGVTRWLPADNLSIHQETRAFLEKEIALPGRKIFVTHHAPHPGSIAPQFAEKETLNGSFASDLSELMFMEGSPDLWIHGGLHHCVDYTVGNTRILSNSLGYAHESTGFDPTAFVDLPAIH